MAKSYAVIGLGRFGSSVARTIAKKGYEVLALEIDETAVNAMSGGITQLLQADSTDINALRAAGIRNCDVVVVAIGSDMQASIMTTLNLKELGIGYIVAKAIDPMHGKVLEKIGADRVVYPEMEMGERVANSLVSKSLVDYIELTPGSSIREIVAGAGLSGRSLRDLNLRVKYQVTIVVIRRDEEILITPGGDTTINGGDVLLVVGKNADLDRFEGIISR